MKNIVFRQDNALIVFRLGTTSNKKIASTKEKIVQTYSFSREQYTLAMGKTSMKEFFSKDGSVCMDCPFAVSNGAKLSACYTHKMMQYSGFLSMLRGIAKVWGDFENLPEYNATIESLIHQMSVDRYVRFGTYGEPSLIPLDLVRHMTLRAKNWTGYTHQWMRKTEYAPYFMASTHNAIGEKIAREKGFRSFVASKNVIEELVNCPASEEQGFRSNCSKCGLCSGTNGKGNKSVVILEH
jgi:hypothetical protein